MSDDLFDVIVIGAGIVGSSAAYQAVKCGYKTLLLEQFHCGHVNGSSHGGSRVIRYQYGTHPEYASWMEEAYKEWEELEMASGEELLYRAGGLSLYENWSQAKSTVDSLDANNVAYTVLSNEEATKKYPMQHFPPKFSVILEEPTMGALRPSLAVKTTQEQFVAGGGKLVDQDAILDILPQSDGTVIVKSQKGATYLSKKLILCAGTWINTLLARMGLKMDVEIWKITVAYWDQMCEESQKINRVQFHMDNDIYVIPELEFKDKIKVLFHHGWEVRESGDVSRSEQQKRDSVAEDVRLLSACVKERFPFCNSEPSRLEHCLYTVTPDSYFVMDKIPGQENIVVGAGFSGHGFKMAPVSGKVLVQLAFNQSVKYDLSKMGIQRVLTSL